ncbi:MAG: hypothetical protein ACE5QF_10110, partial [Thermoplasmata archaeon]
MLVGNHRGKRNSQRNPRGLVSMIAMLMLSSLFSILVIPNSSTSFSVEWQVETVESMLTTGGFSSIDVDSDGRPHVVYRDDLWAGLRYASREGASWSLENVDLIGDTGIAPQIALDSAGRPHVVYYEDRGFPDHMRTKYANKSTGSWSIEEVNHSCVPWTYPSLELDTSDLPHISYDCWLGHFGLSYARRAVDQWEMEQVDVEDISAVFPTVFLSSAGLPWIAYYDQDTDSIKLARRSAGGSWSIEEVAYMDPGESVFDKVHLSLDSADNPHIAYRVGAGGSQGRLVFAQLTAPDPTWHFETVNSSVAIRSFSMVLDGDGVPHVSYRSALTRDLQYAVRLGGSWHNETVDIAERGGNYSSIAVDSDGNPHISYWNEEENKLKYAKGEISHIIIRNVGAEPDPQVVGRNVNISAIVESRMPIVDVLVNVTDPFGQEVGNFSMNLDPATLRWFFNKSYSLIGEHSFLIWVSDINSHMVTCASSFRMVSPDPPMPPTGLLAHLSETNVQDVVLEWNLSQDEANGSVDRYNILRRLSYSSDSTDYQLYDSVPSGTSVYVDTGTGEGNPNDYFYVVCAANMLGNRSCTDRQAAKLTRALPAGPNLVSVPLIQSNESIEVVLQTVM